MKFHLLNLLIVIGNLLSAAVSANPAGEKFRQFYTEQGLSNNSIRSILQDRKGFIWVGTEDGLNKFDGYNWTVYKHDPLDSSSISFGSITDLYEDDRGHLWIAIDEGGLNIYNPYTQAFTHLKHEEGSNSLVSDYVKDLLEDRNGTMWIAAWRGLNAYNPVSGEFVCFTNEPGNAQSISNNDVKCLYEDAEGLIWVGTGEGLNVYDPRSGMFKRYLHQAGHNSISHHDIMCITSDRDNPNLIWIGTTNGLNVLDKLSGRFEVYQEGTHATKTALNNSDIKAVYDDGKGSLWLGTFGGGLNVFNKQTRQFASYTHAGGNFNSISDNYVYCVAEDREGLVWIGTKVGLNTYNTNKVRFNHFLNSPGDVASLSNNRVWAIAPQDSTRLWIGTSRGLNLFDLKTRQFKRSFPGLQNKEIKDLFYDQSQRLWLATTSGLFYYDQKTAQTVRLDIPAEENKFLSVYYDDRQTLWIGTYDGFFTYDILGKKFTHYNIPGSTSNIVYCIAPGPDGTLWFGTFGDGLFYLDPKTAALKRPPGWTTRDGHDKLSVICLHVEADRKVWFGTYGEGLYCYDLAQQNTRLFSIRDGLSGNVVNGLLPGRGNSLWISTNNGINHLIFDRQGEFIIKKYEKDEGLPSYDFNAGAACRDKQGNLFFGAINGLTYFHPDSLPGNNIVPNVLITRFKVFEQDFLLDTAITDKKHITLRYDQNFMSFEFAALSFLFPERNHYKYKMVGLDKDWAYAGNRNYVSYANLEPGTYVFGVKGSNNTGVWNEQGTSVIITITPPFWQETWFYLLCGLVLALLVILIVRWRLRAIREKNEILESSRKIAEFKLMALRSQMNSHFIFNALNSIQHFITINNKQAAIGYLSKFAKLIRQILENSTHSKIPVISEIELIRNYLDLESLRFENKLEYTIDIDETIDIHNIEIPSMLIQPFIENSIIHGLMNKDGKGLVKITFYQKDNGITCEIEDNGVGREEAARIKQGKRIEHRSMGMVITDERLQLLYKDQKQKVYFNIIDLFQHDNATPAGTRIIIHIPVEE